MFPDLSPVESCQWGFASPSGHQVDVGVFLTIILDLFFPSAWSRTTYPSLNKTSIRKSPIIFTVATIICVIYAFLCAIDRIIEGKHTINQVVLGTLVGYWCACLSHFCFRDALFDHITCVTSKVPRFTAVDAWKYTGISSAMVVIAFSINAVLCNFTAHFVKLSQEEVDNAITICDHPYELDHAGNFVFNRQ